MRKSTINKILGVSAVLLAVLGLLSNISPVRADVAPPESPPGVIILPGSDTTEVRMQSEVVTMRLSSGGNNSEKAATTAAFVMRNVGSTEETIEVRFPLSYGEALYYSNLYPEINDFKVEVDGLPVSSTRTTSIAESNGQTIPWAAFPVRFPVGKDVNIVVTYTTLGFGYPPFLTFRYILETGAGWKDTIGSGDIIFQLPYEASPQNVILNSESGFSKVTTGAPQFSGNEVRWHFSDLEPTAEQNFSVDVVSSDSWKKILTERQNTSKNPKDGEAWGRLGKAIKEAIRFERGYLRQDEGGVSLFAEAVQAYEKSLNLLPDDALWHYGFADLLWSHYYFNTYLAGASDYSELTRTVSELKTSLQLDPNYQGSKDLAQFISGNMPWAISNGDQGYQYILLTVTPTAAPATETPVPEITMTEITQTAVAPEATALPSVTQELPAVVVNTPAPVAPSTPVTAKNPLCGSIFILPMLLGFFWYVSKHK